jgi:hypothetical protein
MCGILAPAQESPSGSGTKYAVRRFKSLAVALKEIEPHVRDGKHLQTGKPFRNFGRMRSREVLANVLICAVANFQSEPDRFTFATTDDPIGADGVIEDTGTGETFPTEHVLVPNLRGGAPEDIQALIVEQIELKQGKGQAAYAGGKTLVVFVNAVGGPWYPNGVAKSLPKPLDFSAVWVVGLHGVKDGVYSYNVMQLDVQAGRADVWRVRVAQDFSSWEVEQIQ